MQSAPLQPSGALPFMIRAETPAEARFQSLLEFVVGQRQEIEAHLLQSGAVLLRDFDVTHDGEFEALARAMTPELQNYVEGNSPRTAISSKVYTSTEYPETEFITLHNELSYTHTPPTRLHFYCHVAPTVGGETPIADGRLFLQRVDPAVRERFAAHGVCYVQNMHDGHGLGRSWQQTFETTDRAVIERRLESGGVDFEWKADGGLWTCQVRPAIVAHPVSGEAVWFNQAEQWHVSSLNERAQAALRAAFAPEDYPLHALFGDGSDIDEADLAHVRSVYREIMVAFPWRRGDVLYVDNHFVAHGRNTFRGPRAIRVTMA